MIAGLIRLYPKPWRERWGEDLRESVHASGFRSWPNVLVGAVDMWLHPAVWPARDDSRRLARAAAMAITVAGDGWFVANLITEDGDGRYLPVLRVCGAVLAVGLLLVAPRPRFDRVALGVLLRRGVRGFVPPAVLIAGVVFLVHSGLVPATATPVLRYGVLGIWWGAWLALAANGCRIVANAGPEIVIAPGHRRSIAGTAVLTAATMVSAAVLIVFAIATAEFDAAAAICGALLLALAVTLAGAVWELPALTNDSPSR
ncbi:hypothetical protein EBN03_16135 [Nocardia stercoris]|uniref:Uncharacterized protein n=1 Tax=Nocardia stercoris TaxID=2483361 RepID=A0A3M2L4U4_9NOCA|nr:hypothetical protein EBN03_16135 [Nocardia stercoris]